MHPAARAAGMAAALGVLLGGHGCVRTPHPRSPEPTLVVRQPALYPETLTYDPSRSAFLVSSLRDGGIYRVDDGGRVSRLVEDARLCSVLGIALDGRRRRLWAVNADLGVSLRPSAGGRGQLAAVGAYDAEAGTPSAYADLALLVKGPHLLNGLAVDEASGDAFVTDSFAPVIYRVRASGEASVFLESPRFAGAGINLNGLVVHPEGFLLVVKKSDGALFKVPLAEPSAFSEVRLERALVGGDGVLLVGRDALVVVANKTPTATSNAAFFLTSTDGWRSASITQRQELGEIYPTTVAAHDGQLFVLASHLDELIKAPLDQQPALQREGQILRLARPPGWPPTSSP